MQRRRRSGGEGFGPPQQVSTFHRCGWKSEGWASQVNSFLSFFLFQVLRIVIWIFVSHIAQRCSLFPCRGHRLASVIGLEPMERLTTRTVSRIYASTPLRTDWTCSAWGHTTLMSLTTSTILIGTYFNAGRSTLQAFETFPLGINREHVEIDSDMLRFHCVARGEPVFLHTQLTEQLLERLCLRKRMSGDSVMTLFDGETTR